MKKSKKIIFVGLCGLSLLTGLFANGRSVYAANEWSDWQDTKPSLSSNYEIEDRVVYQYRDKSTTTSTSSTLAGWTKDDTKTTVTWGDWSDWQDTAVTASTTKDVKTRTMYRYRDKSTTTSTSSTLAGWTRDDTKTVTTWSDNWSEWQDTAVTKTATRDVETRKKTAAYKTQYQYWGYTNHFCETCGGSYSETAWFDSPQTPRSGWVWQKCIHGIRCDYSWYIVEGNRKGYYYWERTRTVPASYKTQYRYRDAKVTYSYYKWSDWSSWSVSAPTNASNREIANKTQYSYRDGKLTYSYYKWSDWSNWSTTIPASSATREINNKTQYRYRLKEDTPELKAAKQEAKDNADKCGEESKEAIDKIEALTWQEKEEYKTEVDSMVAEIKQDVGTASDEKSVDGKIEAFLTMLEKKIDNAIKESKKKVLLTDCVFKLKEKEFQYSHSENKPEVLVNYNGYLMEEGVHYTVSYEDNMNCGTATVIVKGTGDRFSGTKSLNFTIVPKDYQSRLNDIKEYELGPAQYDYGNEIFIKKIDKCKLRDDAYTLKAGTDYTIKYRNNRYVGTAKITIKCKGNYKGEVTVKFKIVPRYPAKIVRDKRVKNKIKIKWSRVPEAGGYKVYRSTKQKGGYKLLKTIKSNKTLSYTDKTAKKGTQYYYKIASYKKVSGKVYETKSPALNAKR